MSSFMLIRHKVTDFKSWKAGYDAHEPKRVEAGLTEKYLLRNADAPDEVVVMFEARDLNQAKAFSKSLDLKNKMEEVGVIGKPDVVFLNS